MPFQHFPPLNWPFPKHSKQSPNSEQIAVQAELKVAFLKPELQYSHNVLLKDYRAHLLHFETWVHTQGLCTGTAMHTGLCTDAHCKIFSNTACKTISKALEASCNQCFQLGCSGRKVNGRFRTYWYVVSWDQMHFFQKRTCTLQMVNH